MGADVWESTRGTDGWLEPVKIGYPVSDNSGDEWELTVSATGTLYYSSSRNGGYGNMDLYRSRLTGGTYGLAENLGIPLNTANADECPYIAPDESFMLLNDWKYNPDFGGNNLYITYARADGSWTNPKDLGAKVNSADLDIYPYISPDGKYLFYTLRIGSTNATSSRIYWISTAFLDSIKSSNTAPYQKVSIPSDTLTPEEVFTLSIDRNTFFDDDEGDKLSYSLQMSNGAALPSWISFDTATFTLEGIVPDGAKSLLLVIIATDESNYSVRSNAFRLFLTSTVGNKETVNGSTAVYYNGETKCRHWKNTGIMQDRYKVHLLDISGHRVACKGFAYEESPGIDVRHLNPGIYTVVVEDSQSLHTGKVVVY